MTTSINIVVYSLLNDSGTQCSRMTLLCYGRCIHIHGSK